MTTTRIPARSYSYKVCRPYGAGEMFILDEYVEHYFTGNVPEELIKDGATWDDERHTLTLPNGKEILFVEA